VFNRRRDHSSERAHPDVTSVVGSAPIRSDPIRSAGLLAILAKILVKKYCNTDCNKSFQVSIAILSAILYYPLLSINLNFFSKFWVDYRLRDNVTS